MEGKKTKARGGPGAWGLWLLIILAPILVGAGIGLVSGTSPLRLDAWNTGWNDENGYFRVIRTLRHYGVPRGMTGFNEITNGNIPLGPYNIFTYLPYYALSFLTGTSSHNYIYYCNVILAVAANLLFVALVRPRGKKAVLTALFFLTQLIVGRYTWSGMAEASYHFYIVVFMGLVIWYVRSGAAPADKAAAPGEGEGMPSVGPAGSGGAHAAGQAETETRAAAAPASLARGIQKALCLFAMLALTFFFGVMRPYFAALFLIPLYFIVFRTPGMRSLPRYLCALATVFVMLGTVALMYYFMGYIAEYFEAAPALRLLQVVLGGRAGDFLRGLVQANKDSVRAALALLRERRWAGGVAFLFYGEWAILFLEWVWTIIKKKKDGSAAVLFLLLASGAMIYEATILLYKAYQLHRMLLAITIAYTLFIIECGTVLPWVNAAAVLACVGFYVLAKPSAFALPQAGDASITEEALAGYKGELEESLPYVQVPENGIFDRPANLAPYWENTVAKITEENHIQPSFILPDYLSLNVCTEKFMKAAIKSDSFSSRYLLVKSGTELDQMCRARYALIWEDLGHAIYDRRQADAQMEK